MKIIALLPGFKSLVIPVFTGLLAILSLASAQTIDGKNPAERIRAFAGFSTTVEPPDTKECRVAMAYIAVRVHAGIDSEKHLLKWREIAERVDRSSRTRLEKNPKDNNARNPFEKHALIHAYMICRDKTKIPQPVVDAMKRYVSLYKHKVWFGYGALNYKLMNDGAGFIAAEIWPDLTDSDGLNATRIREATKERLYKEFDEIVRRNTGEYAAPTYLGIDFSAMKLLADFAMDPGMKRRAAYTLDSMFLQVACAWNNGYCISPASRAKGWGSSTTCPEAMDTTAGIAWLYFGGRRPVDPARMNPGGSFWFTIARDYRPPQVFASVATDRSTPFTHRGSVGENIRFTIYQGDQYAVASEWELLKDQNSAHYKESRRNMFKWVSNRLASTFVPLQENPERPYRLSDKRGNKFGYGENPFGQSLQHEGTLIGICSVPVDYPHWKSYAPFTTDGAIIKRIEKEGWVFCHGGSVLFAFRYLQPSYWGPHRDKEKCDVLRSDSRKNGWILETAPVKAFAGGGVDAELGRFAESILSNTRLETADINATTPRFSFLSLSGHVLDICYRGHKEAYTSQHRIDGKPIDYSAFPMFGNPWVKQALGGEILNIKYKGETLIYDFNKWTGSTSKL